MGSDDSSSRGTLSRSMARRGRCFQIRVSFIGRGWTQFDVGHGGIGFLSNVNES